MTYQGTPDLETLQSFMFHYGNAEHLMQFTGVLDRSGKEIYEGDVVKWSTIDTDDDGEPISRELVSSVVYSGHGFWIECESFGWEGEGLWNWKEMEVIGNIYENPELIP